MFSNEIDIHITLGALAVIIAVFGGVPYLVGIWGGKIKPHMFSWIVWALINAIVFVAQLKNGGGAGSWISAFNAGLYTLIAISVFMASKKISFSYISRFDWVILLSCLAAIPAWLLTHNALLAVLTVTIIDTAAFLPSFRKAYLQPFEEAWGLYALSALEFFISLFALEKFNFTTAFYPCVLGVTCAAYTILILTRRKIRPYV